MSSLDNYGLLYPFGKGLPIEDYIPHDNLGERLIPLLRINGSGNHTSLPPPPPIILPKPQVLEKFKVTQSLLAIWESRVSKSRRSWLLTGFFSHFLTHIVSS